MQTAINDIIRKLESQLKKLNDSKTINFSATKAAILKNDKNLKLDLKIKRLILNAKILGVRTEIKELKTCII